MVTRYGQADIPREVSGRRADRRSAPAADFPQCNWTLSKQLPKVVPYHLVFDENQVIRICRPRRLYQGQFRAKYWINIFIQYFAPNWPWYSLRGLHIRITWFSLYGIRIPLFSLYGIHMPLLPYMVIQPIVLGMALLWAAMDSSLSQGLVLWRHNDVTVIVSRNTRGRERDTRQRLDNANARRLQTVNR